MHVLSQVIDWFTVIVFGLDWSSGLRATWNTWIVILDFSPSLGILSTNSKVLVWLMSFFLIVKFSSLQDPTSVDEGHERCQVNISGSASLQWHRVWFVSWSWDPYHWLRQGEAFIYLFCWVCLFVKNEHTSQKSGWLGEWITGWLKLNRVEDGCLWNQRAITTSQYISHSLSISPETHKDWNV